MKWAIVSYFLTMPDSISWKLRCDVHEKPFRIAWFSLRAKLTKCFLANFNSSETEQIRWGNREDQGGWWFGRHSSYTASPHHTPRRKRYSPTTEHDTGAHCRPARCARKFWCANISEQGSIVETKNLGGGLGCTPVDDPIMLPHIEEVEEGPMLGGKKQKSLPHSKVYKYKPRINIHFKTPFLKQNKS